MHLVLTGATGLVGGAVLRAMLQDTSVTQVTILSRRAVPMADGHSKARVILHSDFATYPAASSALGQTLASARGVVWALGISQASVSKDAYEQITHDYALAFARFWAEASQEAASTPDPQTLVFVSGEGATHTPGMLTPRFGGVKGRTEMALLDMSAASKTLTVWAVRPAGVDPRSQTDLLPFVPSVGVGRRALLATTAALWPAMISPTAQTGEVMTELAKGGFVMERAGASKSGDKADEIRVEGGEGKGWRGGVVRNAELRRLGGW